MGCNTSHHKDANPNEWHATKDAPSQVGRVVVVTGANTGIGEVTVEYMLSKGATVVMACRNMKKAKKARKEVLDKVNKWEEKAKKTERSTGDINSEDDANPVPESGPRSYAEAVRVGVTGAPPAKDRLFIEELDLNKFASIRQFAQRVESRQGAFKLGSVDTLILNAGVRNLSKVQRTADGFERQWQTNFLGHFLLVGELMTALRRCTRQPIVVPVSDYVSHKSRLTGAIGFDFKFENQWKDKYSGESVYNDTKLATLLFATELKNRHGDWLRVIPCHPGVCGTRLFRHSIKILTKGTLPAAETGAEQELRAATDTTLPNGTYIGTGGSKTGAPVLEQPGEEATDPAAASALWTAAERAVGITY